MLDPMRQSAGSEAINARQKADSDGQIIYQSLSGSIVEGRLKYGSRLPTERALANRYGAARNTVRRAMSRLAEEGLIERHVGRGTFVAKVAAPATAPLSEPDFSLGDLLEARLMFEPMLAELVTERAADTTLAALSTYLEALNTAATWAEFKEAKYALHLAIVKASGNAFLVSVFEQIIATRRKAGWGRPDAQHVPIGAVREAAVRDNAAIVEALCRRDTETARELIRAYLLRTLMSVGGS
jgi:GntR family transcriptional repressor for pyruvate dehydrogenase complex